MGEPVAAIEFHSTSLRLSGREVLRELSFSSDVKRLAIIGENGSGKSSLARLIGGLLAPSSGQARILGLDPVRELNELRRRVALVFSNPDVQIVMPTVAEDVAFSLRQAKLPRAELQARVSAALERFGLSELASHSTHELSGGQKQLLALAGAFVREPELVIADEPTGYLDARNARRIADHLLGSEASATSPASGASGASGAPGGSAIEHRLVLVTHDLSLAARCDQAILIDDGRISNIGAPREVIAQYERQLAC